MLQIFKYPVAISDSLTIEMPEGAQVLSVQIQHEQAMLWALVNPHKPLTKRHFLYFGTGHLITEPVDDLRFVGTVQIRGGSLVFHLFEVVVASSA